jgi:hypothetical protein
MPVYKRASIMSGLRSCCKLWSTYTAVKRTRKNVQAAKARSSCGSICFLIPQQQEPQGTVYNKTSNQFVSQEDRRARHQDAGLHKVALDSDEDCAMTKSLLKMCY